MKKAQNVPFDNRAIDELCARYRNRGMNYSGAPESAEQEDKELSSRTVAPSFYKTSFKAAYEKQKYKNGIENGRRYMTDGDFVNFYRATREYAPAYENRLDTAIVLDNIDQKRYKKISPDKTVKKNVGAQLRLEADRVNPKARVETEIDRAERKEKKDPSVKTKKTNKAEEIRARRGEPLEREERRFDFKSMLTFGAITLSLILIIGSAVIFGIA